MRRWILDTADTVKERDDILELHKIVFPTEDKNKELPEYFNWEFINNYYGKAEIYVARDGKKLAGHYAVIPQKFIINGEQVRTGLVVDVMTHPDYRKQGMFVAIGEYSLEKTSTDFAIGYPIRKEVIPGHIKIGWEIVKKIPIYFYPIRFDLLLYNYIKNSPISKYSGRLVSFFFNLLFRNRKKYSEIQISSVKNLSEYLETFFEKQYKKFEIYQEKDTGYVKWRYDSNALLEYNKFIVNHRDNVAAYFVTRVKEFNNLKCMNIIDLEVVDFDRKILSSILRFTIELAKEMNLAGVAFMLIDDGCVSKKLLKYGFIKSPLQYSLIIHNNKKHDFIEDFKKSNKIYLNWSDTDVG